MVIEGQFLAASDPTLAEEQQVPPDAANGKIGITTVIDAFRSAAAHCAVNKQSGSERDHVDALWRPEPEQGRKLAHVGPPTQVPAGVLNYLPARRDRLASKHAVPVEARTTYAKPKASIARIDAGQVCRATPADGWLE